jgi:hypothetical protein
MLKDKRGTRSYGSFLQTESLCCRFREWQGVFLWIQSKFGKHSIKVKDSFAVEAGSGPRHLTFSKGGMFMYYRNLLEVWWSFLFEESWEKSIKQLANGFKELSQDILSPDGKFYMLKPWGSEYDFNL